MYTMRASYEQVKLLIQFMLKHPSLGEGGSKSVEDRNVIKALWHEISVKLNAVKGAKKTAKGWAKYWVDKKCYLRKMASRCNSGSQADLATYSPIDTLIMGFFDKRGINFRARVKREVQDPNEMDADEAGEGAGSDVGDYEEEQSVEYEQIEKPIEFVERPLGDTDEERHAALIDRMLQIMSEQASALTKIAEASQTNARALNRLAEASQQRTDTLHQLVEAVTGLAQSFAQAKSALP